jgi:hypothetical protein
MKKDEQQATRNQQQGLDRMKALATKRIARLLDCPIASVWSEGGV